MLMCKILCSYRILLCTNLWDHCCRRSWTPQETA